MPIFGNVGGRSHGSLYGGRTPGPVDELLPSYAMSDNPLDTTYFTAGEVTLSETNHRATFINSASTVNVARALTGYGSAGQIRAVEFELMVLGGGTARIGFRASLTQIATTTSLGDDAGDVAYGNNGRIYVGGVDLGVVAATYAVGDKPGAIYNVSLGMVVFYKNGAPVYTVSGVSGDLTPALQGLNNNTNSVRINTAWSYPLPAGVLYYR